MAEPLRLDEHLTDGSGVYFHGTLIDLLQTAHQKIEVFDTPDLGKLMRIDGANMVSDRDEFFYHENLVHPAAISHPAPRRALIVGGGDGGAAEELLKHRGLTHVVMVELDEGVIALAKKHFAAVHRGAFDDPRLEVRIGDGLTFVRDTTERFDLIYLDLTDPIGPAEALYTQAFYADCQRALNDAGALILHLGSPFSHRERVRTTLANLAAVFANITPYFVHIPMYGATWGFAIASSEDFVSTLREGEIDRRLAERGIGGRRYYNGATHHAMQALPEYLR